MERFFLLWILLGCAVHGICQPSSLAEKDIVFEHPDPVLGLSQQSINCMIQDSDGFLWIGTWTGLILYDGYTTTVFQSNSSSTSALRSNKITTLFEDRDGYIWVGTMMGGIYKYDKSTHTFTSYQYNPMDGNSLSSNNVWSIVQDSQGKLWIGTENGLNHFDPQTGIAVRFYADPQDSNSQIFNFVTSLYIDHSSNLWVGTERGVSKLDLTDPQMHFERYYYAGDEESAELHNYVYKITSYFDEEDNEIISWSTKKGLKVLEGNRISNYQMEEREAGFNFFRTLYTYQNSGNYLLLGSEMGMSIFDPKRKAFIRFFGNFDKQVNLSHNTVTAVFIDKTGVLWIGTKKGINKFDTYNKNFDLYLTDSFDPTKSIITGIEQSTSGNLWVSTMGGGLYHFNPLTQTLEEGASRFKRYKLKTAVEDDFAAFVQKLYTDSKGNIWIGSAGSGVYMFNEKNIQRRSSSIIDFKNFRMGEGDQRQYLSDNYIMAFWESKDGGIWVGTWSGGINKIMPDGQIVRYQQEAFTQVPIVALYEDNSGFLWIGTRGKGLLKASLKDNAIIEWQTYTSQTSMSISNDFINVIYEDNKGRVWIGTEGGLDYFDRRRNAFKTVEIKDRESPDVVVSLLQDEDGNIWYAHWNGITVLDTNDENYKVINDFDIKDRIQGGFFYNGVSLKDSRGNLYFGGANGFNILYPDKINTNPFQPTIRLRDFRIFNDPIHINTRYHGRPILKKPLSQTEAISLKHFENSLSLEFSALHYSAPEKNKYAYRLKGFEENWKYTDANRRYANYTNLPFGDYVFEVKASNGDGVWTNEVRKLIIHIAPPWYRTWYAIVGYVLMVFMVLYFFRKFIIMRTNYINDIRIERMNRENIEKLNKAKLQFFTNISHEFRTPLTLILGPLEKIMSYGEGETDFKEHLGTINRNAQRLLRLVNQLLDFRKAEAGKLKLRVSEGNIVEFIKELKLSFEGLAERKRIKFDFKASADIILLWFDPDQFEKILYNLLSNAFNHTPEGGTITIGAIASDDTLEIFVEDNGSGIKPENFKSIFKRFNSNDTMSQSTGIGLALTKSLVEMHCGHIKVDSVEHEYSRFTVKLPLGRGHFKDSEIAKTPTAPSFVKGAEEYAEYSQTIASNSTHATGKKILIVEDNAEVRAFIRSIFASNYEILEAENGREGLAVAEAESPEVILSDVMMPGMDGLTFCKHIKENVRTSHIPIILLTARTSLIAQLEGMENGADDYITKPFNAQLLQLKIRNLIESREQFRRLFSDNETLKLEPKKVTLTSADADFIQIALDSIELNMSNSEYSVEEFGKDVGMSRMQLYRKLKALTGMSANEFIRSIRLKRAAQLLSQNQLTVAEVTYEVGFTDLQYFRNCFKKQFGTNPSEYGKTSEKIQ